MSAAVAVDFRPGNGAYCRRLGSCCHFLLGVVIFMTVIVRAVDVNNQLRHRSDASFERPKERISGVALTVGSAEQVDNVDMDDVDGEEALERRDRRQSFSMIQDLDALAEMLRETSQRRRMQNALAFFNALRKRGEVIPRLISSSSVTSDSQQQELSSAVDHTRT